MSTARASTETKTVLYLHFSMNPVIHRRFLEGMRRFARTTGWRVEAFPIDDLSPEELRERVRASGAIGCVRDSGRQRPRGAERSFCVPHVPIVLVEPGETDRSSRAGAVFCDNAAIAGRCGFGSEIELRRLFRRRFGSSMTAWRARNSI